MNDQQDNQTIEAEQKLNSEADSLVADEAPEQDTNATTGEASLADQLAKALEESEQHKEAALRAQAETQNVRRRAEIDVEKAHKFGLEKFAKEIINVADNLERALSSVGDSDDMQSVKEGVELTFKGLVETLARFEVQPVDPHGEPFNPELHQAITMVPNPQMEPNTVMEVIQKGYTLHGRLLRPAMVVVSQAG